MVEHGPDEYADIASLVKTAEIIADAIVRLCGDKT
jgi:acetylornithine deacetylase/succinyl-diaminopimelate desuccinylase-like protein